MGTDVLFEFWTKIFLFSGFVAFVFFVAELFVIFSDYSKTKKFDDFENKIQILIVTFLIMVCSVPYYAEIYASYNFGTNRAIKVLNFALKIPMFSSSKAELYYELSRNYKELKQGNNAIYAYEKAVFINEKSSLFQKSLICPVYFWKEDSSNIQQICPRVERAIDYLNNKKYEEALKTINKEIDELENSQKQENLCIAYAIRGVIYKKDDSDDSYLKKYKKDYDKVKSECKSYEYVLDYFSADDILDVYLGGREENDYNFYK